MSPRLTTDPLPPRRTLPLLGQSSPPLPAAVPGPDAEQLFDGLRRRVSYLRISLTDRCNYRCTYCMPESGTELVPRADLLSFEELEQLVRALVAVGVRRVRLTGGEPTVRKDLVELVERLGRLGLDDLALSTNGERLRELAVPLRRAGLKRLNVSLDTLDAAKFLAVTRRGQLDRVLDGLEAARSAGFVHTKLNTVAMAGWNDDELGAICRYAFDRDFTPRFIELMPMAEGALFYPGSFLAASAIRDRLTAELGPLELDGNGRSDPASALPGVGPARYATLDYRGRRHRLGIISAVSEPFCESCNRIRLSAAGKLHACLGYDDAIDLRPLLRQRPSGPLAPQAVEAALVEAIRQGLTHKRPAHEFSPTGCGGPKKYMVTIGG